MLRLKTSTLLLYALPTLPLAILTTPAYIFLPSFYGETLGLGLASVGFILLLARLWDVVSDFIIGTLSDSNKSLFGRRHVFVLAGLPLTLLSTWFLLVPPDGAGSLHLLGWSSALYLGWTMMILPLNALGAELSSDYHERTRITAWREGLTVAGVLLSLGVVAVLGFSAEGQARSALFALAVMVLVLLPIATALFCVFVPRPQTLKTNSFTISGLKVLWHNHPFRTLIGSYLLNGLANGLPATLFILFATHVLQKPEYIGGILFIYFFCGIISIPLWAWASRKYGKNEVWSFAMCLACVFFSIVPFIGASDVMLFAVMSVLTGLCLGADLSLPASMQADVVDIDRARTSEDRAGLFFAFWGMATKLALALAAGLALPAIDGLGFDPAQPSPTWPIVLFYGVIPIALKISAILLMRRYKLDAKTVASIQLNIPAP